ncbi:hypothetical protein KC19_12G074400 [Ceratodon purpureus]|uniref:BCNT-C domain-containing protein n=1 Tax=Ceratodon purpureus TaxID=3225 RepID=A0A8T0G4L2_CERPU|nr:hypothetical protein KC19_12G074400 [Ceratodon purpureus]
MADSAERNGDGEISVKPEGNNSTDERAAMKANINSIWEELKGRDSLPAKVMGLPKVQRMAKPKKPSKAVPSWMVNLGLAPPKGSAIQKPALVHGDQLPKVTNGSAGNGILKDSQVIIDQAQVEAKESRTASASDVKVKEVLSRLREGADTTTNSNSKASEDSKAAHALRRKSEMQASSSSGLDSLLQQISKKQKPNILDRSRKDWGQFKEEKGIEDELEAYKKSGDKYLDKVAFLQRSDVREYEKERDARLALQSKQRSETAPLI